MSPYHGLPATFAFAEMHSIRKSWLVRVSDNGEETVDPEGLTLFSKGESKYTLPAGIQIKQDDFSNPDCHGIGQWRYVIIAGI